MKKYYCPITNEQFNQLLNFGQIFIPQYLAVEHSDDFQLVQSNLVETFVKYIRFKYDEEYLILELVADLNIQEKILLINICNVEHIFPISDECHKAITFKYSKIKFSEPIFTLESLSKINDAYFRLDSENGVEYLMSIFENSFDSTILKNEEVILAALKFRKRKKINSLQPNSSIIDFTFLYAYQAYYPLTTLGYFYRTSEILTRKALSSKSIPYNHEILEKTAIYKLLEELRIDKPESNLQEIINILEKDDRATKFIANLSDSLVKYFIIIPMFLKIIDEFNDNNQSIEKTSLEKIFKKYSSLYKTECQQLVLWVGAYLGYGNCYDYFYSKRNLKFFKSQTPIPIIQENKAIAKVESEILMPELEIENKEINSKFSQETTEANDNLVNNTLVEITNTEENIVSIDSTNNQQTFLNAPKNKGEVNSDELSKERKSKTSKIKKK